LGCLQTVAIGNLQLRFLQPEEVLFAVVVLGKYVALIVGKLEKYAPIGSQAVTHRGRGPTPFSDKLPWRLCGRNGIFCYVEARVLENYCVSYCIPIPGTW
jgi:hypothetical protein